LWQLPPLCDVAEFKDPQFSVDRQYSSNNPSGKSPMALGLVSLWTMLGNCLFQYTYLESTGFKIYNVSKMQGVLHPAEAMYHKAMV
jgi:hypothetical protein